MQSTAQRLGARDLTFHETESIAAVEFTFQARRVRLTVALPAFDLFMTSATGKQRITRMSAAHKDYKDGTRSCWKALGMLMRAKIYAVQKGARTFEQEFGEYVIGHVDADIDAEMDDDALGDAAGNTCDESDLDDAESEIEDDELEEEDENGED